MSKRYRFHLWPWLNWRCDDCGALRWSWRGFWYRPSDMAESLPTIIAEFRALSDSAGVFSQAGLIKTPVPTEEGARWSANNYTRVFAEDYFKAEDEENARA